MSTSIRHKRFVELVTKGLKKALENLVEDSIKQNDDLVVADANGNVRRVKARDLKK